MKKIFFPFIGKDLGGSHISTFLLANGLDGGGEYRAIIVCPSGTRIEEEAKKEGIEVICTSDTPVDRHSILHDFSHIPEKLRFLHRHCGHQSILHFNDLRAMQSWIVPAKTIGLPVVFHNRALNKFSYMKAKFTSLADHFISISDVCHKNIDFLPNNIRHIVSNPFTDGRHPENQSCTSGDAHCETENINVSFIGNFPWSR